MTSARADAARHFSNWAVLIVLLALIGLNAATAANASTSANAGDFVQVVSGQDHTLALQADGTVWSWGYDGFGQLGDDRMYQDWDPEGGPSSDSERYIPTQVAGLTDVRQVAAGANESFALKADGTIWAWGRNSVGQLGLNDGNFLDRPYPVQVTAISGVRQIAAGSQFTFALKIDGTVWAWGKDTTGQLGNDAALVNQLAPVQVAGLTGVRQITAGNDQGFALKSDGTVWSWGWDLGGALGDSVAIANQPTPVAVSGLTNIRMIASGFAHSLALKADGTLMSWGSDTGGALGNDVPIANQNVPVVVATVNNVIDIDAGLSTSFAVKADGTLWGWGADGSGQVGNNVALVDQPMPVVIAGATSIVHTSAGSNHTIAVKADGTMLSWGTDFYGQLGNDIAVSPNQPTPVAVSWTTFCGYTQIAAGGSHTLALKADGTVWAWGDNSSGQLGDNVGLVNQPMPVQVAGLTGVRSIAAGSTHSLAVKSDGTAWAWGSDSNGKLGDNVAIASQPTPVQVATVTNVVQVDAGQNHSVAVKADGTVWSWGSDSDGQLGDNAGLVDQPTPVQVAGLTTARSVAGGRVHTLGLLTDGTMRSWGDDSQGQLGDNAGLVDQSTPVTVAGQSLVRSIGAGLFNTSLSRNDGTVWSIGDDAFGQLGDNVGIADQPTAVQVTGVTDALSVGAGYYHGLAARVGGSVSTWGRDNLGQLGDDAPLADKPTPVAVATVQSIGSLSGGNFQTGLLRANGTIWMDGSDTAGQLGDNVALVNQPTPVMLNRCPITVSGFAYAAEAGGAWIPCDGATTNVALSINGGAAIPAFCDNLTGAVAFGSQQVVPNDVLAIYLNDNVVGTNDAVTYYKVPNIGSNVAGLATTPDRVRIASFDGFPVTNASIALFDATNDTDIPINSNRTNSSTTGTTKIHIDVGRAFEPGGNVTSSTMHLEGRFTGKSTASMTTTGGATAACTAGPATMRPLCIGAGRFFPSGTTRFAGTAALVDVEGTSYTDLTFEPNTAGAPIFRLGSGASTTITVTGDMTVGTAGLEAIASTSNYNPNVTVTDDFNVGCSSTLSGSGTGTFTVRGDVAGCGDVDLTAGLFHQRALATANFGFDSGNNDWTFNNLRFSGGQDITVNSGGSGTTYVVLGTLDIANTVTGWATLENDLADRTFDLVNLNINDSGGLYGSSSATMSISGNFYIDSNGSYSNRGGPIVLDGATPTTIDIEDGGYLEFQDLSITTPNKVVNFDNLDQVPIYGTFTVDGGSCATPVQLRSKLAGDQVDLYTDAAVSVQYADVKDIGATPGFTANNSFNSLNNTNVTVLAGACQVLNLTWLTGFEHGVLADASELFSTVTSGAENPTIENTVVRNGSYALKVAKPTGTSNAYVGWNVGGTVMVERFAVRFAAMPGATIRFASVATLDGTHAQLQLNPGTSRLEARIGATIVSGTTPIVAGQWYVVDMRFNVLASPRTIEWQVNGVAQTTTSVAMAGSTLTQARWGGATAADVFTAYYDDIAMSSTSADYPFGDGKVLALRPDGRVANGLDVKFSEEAGTAFGALSHLRVDDSPMTPVDRYIRQDVVDATAFAELSMQDAGLASNARGIRGLAAYHTESGTAATASSRFRSGATESVVFSGAMGSTPIVYRGQMLTAPAGGWSPANLNALNARIGYASAITGKPSWDSLLVEAEFPVTPGIGSSISIRLDGYDVGGAGPHTAPATMTLGAALPTNSVYAESRVFISTDAANGYTLALADADGNGGMYDPVTVTNMPWMDCAGACSVATPGVWSGSGMAISAFGLATTPAKWCNGNQALCPNTGTPAELQDADLRWAPLTGASQVITSRASAIPAGETTRIPVRVTVPGGQLGGVLAGEVTYTATAIP